MHAVLVLLLKFLERVSVHLVLGVVDVLLPVAVVVDRRLTSLILVHLLVHLFIEIA